MGRWRLSGMYLNELTGLCRPEELMRLFRYATQLAANRPACPIDSAMISDVPGYTWGTVTGHGSGGDQVFLHRAQLFRPHRHHPARWENKPFWWVGPDGQVEGAGLDSVLGLCHVPPLSPDVAAVGRGFLRRPGKARLSLRHRLCALERPRRQRGAGPGHLRFRARTGTPSTPGRSS